MAKQSVGRPEKKGEKKTSRSISILPSSIRKANKLFGTIGEAVEYAIQKKESEKLA